MQGRLCVARGVKGQQCDHGDCFERLLSKLSGLGHGLDDVRAVSMLPFCSSSPMKMRILADLGKSMKQLGIRRAEKEPSERGYSMQTSICLVPYNPKSRTRTGNNSLLKSPKSSSKTLKLFNYPKHTAMEVGRLVKRTR